MTAPQGDRRRTALSTLGKGARGLTCFWEATRAIVLAGTALAGTDNELHALAHEEAENTLKSLFVLRAPAEVWSLDRNFAGDQDSRVLVGARRGSQSRIEVWGLPSLSDFVELPVTSETERDKTAVDVKVISSADVAGLLLKARPNPSAPSEVLSLTHTDFCIIDVSDSSTQTPMNMHSTKNRTSKGDAGGDLIIDGDWIDVNTAMIASQKDLRIFDKRSGKTQSRLDIKHIVENSKQGSQTLWVPPHPSRMSSACSGPQGALYAGFQDGKLRALDMRTSEMIWEAKHSRNQWVSTVCSFPQGGVLSGGTDGVVKCWGQDGMALATFPHHDDTVTSACCSSKSFATVSYDGRLALNELPA